MLTGKYKDTGEVINILKYDNPRDSINKLQLVCKFCNQPLGIRHGLLREKHFYHLTKCSSGLERHPESPEHNLGKELIAEHVAKFWKEYSTVKVEFEYPLPEINRIADIAMVFPSGWVVVHEIQLSSITNEHLEKRTKDYQSIGIDTFWWLGKSANSTANREWCIKNYGYALLLEDDLLEAKAKDIQI